MKELRDPSKPPGWVGLDADGNPPTDADGMVIRNDGKLLTPAERNPWYELMTIAGEPESYYDEEVIAKNRRYWNGRVCAEMGLESRNEMAKRLRVSPQELEPLTEAEVAQYNVINGSRFESGAFESLPGRFDFRKTFFRKPLFLRGFAFPQKVDFWSSSFSDFVDFQNSAFHEGGLFRSLHFDLGADFSNAYFGGVTHFQLATFEGAAIFDRSVFSGPAIFRSAQFSEIASFSYGEFGGETSFQSSRFEGYVPTFFQRIFHQNTELSISAEYWPKIADMGGGEAREAKRAYTRLAQVMSELHKPDDEQFFRRQEMRCAAVLADGPHRWMYRAYEAVSDFGYSVWRPVAFLALTVVLGFELLAIGGCPMLEDQKMPQCGWNAVGMSIGNTFGFLGFGRLYFGAEVFRALPAWLQVLGAAQTILGVVFLFFFGLGLRNRFRLK